MLRAERDYPGHPELAGFCDEAHSLLAGAAIPAAPLTPSGPAAREAGSAAPVGRVPGTDIRLTITYHGQEV